MGLQEIMQSKMSQAEKDTYGRFYSNETIRESQIHGAVAVIQTE